MAVGTTFDSNINRNDLIALAYRDLGVLAAGDTLSSDLLADGITKLNFLIRQMDMYGKHLNAVGATPSTLTLVANTWTYTSTNGLPTNIYALTKVSYRNAAAEDQDVTILTHQDYENIQSKLTNGDPSKVFLSENITIGSRQLFVYPTLSTVNTQSVVTGTDAAAWKCIRSHTADSTNKPITGANYLLYWESGGSGAVAWVTGTSYTAPQHLRLWFRKPLFDFDAATDNPDLPQGWARYLLCSLEYDLAMGHGLSMQEMAMIKGMRDDAYMKLFPGLVPAETNYHNRGLYF